MNDNKINSFGFSTLLVHLCSSSFFGVLSSYILNKSKTDTLLSLLIGFIISLFISSVSLSLFNRKIIPKRINNLFNIILILCSVFGYILLTYRLTTFISNQYLVETPKYLISLLILILTFYTASKGIEVISRVSTITFYFTIINFLFDIFNLINKIKFDNFLPLFTTNYKNVLISSILFALFFSVPTIYINSIKKDELTNKDKFKKYYYLMISFSFIIIFTSVFISIGVSGIKINNLFDYPIYTTLKRIKLFNFLDSLENISISSWFLFIINSSSIILYYIFTSLKETFNLKNTKINYLIMIICFIIPNFIFSNNNYNEIPKYILIPSSILLLTFIIALLNLILFKIKKKD